MAERHHRLPERLPAPPGARTSCALLTLLTVMLAWPSPEPDFAVLTRPAYFALLTWFFWRTGRSTSALHSSAMRLVQSGFFVLWLGYTIAAGIHFSDLERDYALALYLREACERGAWFLLGTTLIAYGLMLWIPQIVRSHELLQRDAAETHGELQRAQSERSALEQRLVDADRLGMLGELAASIAHDLRNPLTVVKGTAESLCRKPRTPAEVAQHTDVIRRNIDKADQTIESLIDLARPQQPHPTELDAKAAIEEVAGLLQVEARRRGVALVVDAPHAPRIYADHTLLVQALLNLSLNALQASPAGAAVTLRATTRRDAALLLVEDRGHGLKPEVRSRLFRPFFTTKSTGTGLGLLSCRRIARELGGDMRLYPRTRGGTRALMCLPVRTALTAVAGDADGGLAWPARC